MTTKLPFNIRALVALLSLCFLVGGLRLAGSIPLWMDEVLAVWVIRLHSSREVLSALWHGSEFAPPTYHLILHWIASVAGTGYRVLRLPSLLAGLVSGLCIFALLRRYLLPSSGAFGLAFTLLGILSTYALQVRPYIFVVACYSIDALLWDDLRDAGAAYLSRVALIGILLALAIAFHFYAVLLVLCFAVMELAWSLLNRRLRIAVWVALFFSGASSLVWLPLIRTLSQYNSGDTSSVAYYAKPTPGKLVAGYVSLFVSDKRLVLFLMVAVICCGAWYALREGGLNWLSSEVADNSGNRSKANLLIIAFAAIIFPTVVFLFSKVVTKTFNVRYCLIATLGFTILASCIFDNFSGLPSVLNAVLLLTACALVFLRPPAQLGESVPDILTLLPSAKNPYPIVVGEGLEYLQLEEAAPPAFKDRIYFVTSPEGSQNADPTNENQVKRWKAIRPDLKVVDAKTFFGQNPHFYLLHTAATADSLTDWLTRRSLVTTPVAYTDDAWLFEAQAPR